MNLEELFTAVQNINRAAARAVDLIVAFFELVAALARVLEWLRDFGIALAAVLLGFRPYGGPVRRA